MRINTGLRMPPPATMKRLGARGKSGMARASAAAVTAVKVAAARPQLNQLDSDSFRIAEPRDLTDAVTARLLECSGFSTPAELRCVRNPQRVALLDARGQFLMEGTHSGDAALFHVGPGDLVQLQVQFS